MKKRVYKVSSMKEYYIIVAFFGFFLAGAIPVSLMLSRKPMPLSQITGAAVAVGVILVITFTILLICRLADKKRTITLNSMGGEVIFKRPLGKSPPEKFLWREVSAVNISSITKLTGKMYASPLTTYKVSVFAKGRTIYLMDENILNKKLKSLVEYVGTATAHLDYVWQECRTDETRPILETTEPFCKVALNAETNNVVNQTV